VHRAALTSAFALVVFAAVVTGCSAGPGQDWSGECRAAAESATAEAVQLLSAVDAGRIGQPGAAFQSLPQVCGADAGAAYSQVVVDAHDQFEPTTPAGELVRDQWARSACGPSALVPAAELTDEVRALCANP
jgi:hypothetical protein